MIKEIRSVFDQFPQLVTIRNLQTGEAYINPAARLYSGITEQEATTIDPLALIHPTDVLAIKENWQDIEKENKAICLSYRVLNANGEYRWHSGSITMLRDEDDRPQYLLIISTNIHLQKMQELEVLQNEERLRTAISVTHNPMWDYNVLTGKSAHSPEITHLYDLEPGQEFSLDAVLDLIHTNDKEKVKAGITELLRNPNGATEKVFEYRVTKKDGSIRWHRTAASVLINEQGIRHRLLGMVSDITERKLLQLANETIQQRLEQIGEVSQTLLWMTDTKGQLVFTNKVAENWTGINYRKLTMNQWKGFVHPDDVEACVAAIRYSLLHHTPHEIYFRFFNHAGKLMWLHTSAAPLFEPDGSFSGLAGSTSDITAIKLSELAALQNEEQFRELANLIPQLVWISDKKGHVTWHNSRWIAFFGEEMPGNEPSIHLHPDDVQHTLDTWFGSVKSGEPYEIEYRFFDRSTQKYRWFLGKAIPVKDRQGEIVKWLGTCTDIDAQKDLKQNLDSAMQLRSGELLRLAQQLRKSNEDLQQFAHITSHDMKEPLRKISIFTDKLEESYGHVLHDDGFKLLSKIRNASNRVSEMVEDILSYTLVSNETSFNTKVDLQDVLRKLEQDLELIIHQKNASVLYTGLPQLVGNEQLIYQLFSNLLNNALKFSRQDLSLQITVKSQEATPEAYSQFTQLHAGRRYAQIVVQDNGIGFEPEYAEHIFKAFTRLHSGHIYEGTGLGLALCQKIVQRHGGHIYAESEMGKGAKFIVYLPLAS